VTDDAPASRHGQIANVVLLTARERSISEFRVNQNDGASVCQTEAG
jgi:hypothetical protein